MAQQQTECLLDILPDLPEHLVRVRVRFLRLQAKTVQERTAAGDYRPVESLDVGDERYLSFDEALPRECDFLVNVSELLAGGRSFPVRLSAGEQIEPLGDSGRIVRMRWPVEASVTITAECLDTPHAACKLRVRTENTVASVVPTRTRAEALRYSLIATHTLLRGRGLRFLSLTEPPEWAVPHATACRNIHTFPVLVGDPTAEDSMLSSPIPLYDYPRVAPESPGDVHDAAEIDEILDRVDDKPEEVMARLRDRHGWLRAARRA